MKDKKRTVVRDVCFYILITLCVLFFLKIYLVDFLVEKKFFEKNSGLGIEPTNDFICPDGTPTMDLDICEKDINKFTLKTDDVFSYTLNLYTYAKCPVSGIKNMYVLPGFLNATIYVTYDKNKSNCENYRNYLINEEEIKLRYRPLFINVIDEKGKTYINVTRN